MSDFVDIVVQSAPSFVDVVMQSAPAFIEVVTENIVERSINVLWNAVQW